MEIRLAVRENRLSDPRRVQPADCAWFIANSTIWVIECDGTVRAFAAGDPRDGNVWALFVEPSYERRGFGRALISRVCSDLAAKGFEYAWLSTEPGTRAERFYRANGWIEGGMTARDEIIFRKQLTEQPRDGRHDPDY
jgi:ribosomal protein S18 acetylase RimI-like enzyme